MPISKASLHNHICLLYKNKQEKFSSLISFLRAGFLLNNKCLYIAGKNDCEVVRKKLTKSGREYHSAMESGALTFSHLEDYSHGKEPLSIRSLLSSIRKDVYTALGRGFSALRIIIEMPLGKSESYDPVFLNAWEKRLNSFLAKNKCLALCLFRVADIPSETLQALLHNHIITITGGITGEDIFVAAGGGYPGTHSGGESFLTFLIPYERAQKKIRQYKEWYRTLVDNANEAIMIVQDSNFKYINRKAEVLTNYSEQELKALSLLDLIHPDDRDMMLEIHQQSIRGKISLGNYTVRIITKHRETRWTEMIGAYIEWEGKPATLGLFTDITDRRIAEAALSASEERYRLLVEKANEAIVVVQDGMVKFCNPKALEFACYTEEEMYSRPFLEFIHPDDRADVINRYFARISGEMSEDVIAHFRLISGNGDIRYEEVRAMVIDWEGRPAVFDMITDVTERKLAEDSLKESEERYRRLVETSPDPIVMYDLKGDFILINLQTAYTYGVSSIEEFLSEIRNVSDLLDDNGKTQAIEDFKKTLDTGFSSRKEYTIYNKDRSPIRVEINSSTIIGHDSKPVAFISIVRDISGRERTNVSLGPIAEEEVMNGRN